ncbi:MAG: hypothetical protein H6550_15970 [Chitinophagales bacterium]|nr:hypothetical protein [Chitinophagales bacterium]
MSQKDEALTPHQQAAYAHIQDSSTLDYAVITMQRDGATMALLCIVSGDSYIPVAKLLTDDELNSLDV